MNSFRHRREIISFILFPILLLFSVSAGYALILPPDPFESTDRFALLNPASDGTITQILVKIKAPGQDPLGPGELWALLQYRQNSPGRNRFHFAASKPVPIQRLSNTTPALIELDFSGEPIPAKAYHKTLLIYFNETSVTDPILLSKYRPEQLLLNTPDGPDWTPPPPLGGSLIFGPTTLLREREKLKTEQVPFSVSDNSGPYLLRLTNGTPEGSHRVSSALVKLNGKEVFRPSDFNQRVAGLSRQVTLLLGGNLLEVRLRSAPGAFVTLEIYRLDSRTCLTFGPQTFIRSKGKPREERVVFEINPHFFGPFALNLTSGDSHGSHRVDSAIIRLNGKMIFDPNDFNEQTKHLSQLVSLQPSNTLSVELRGAPGDLLTIDIIGNENTPPSIKITNPINGATFKTSRITVSGAVDDPTSSVTVNGMSVTVSSDGSFILDGIDLGKGKNVIRAVATDSCGNQGEDQIEVYLKTVPEGPYLLFCPEPFYERRPDLPEVGCSEQIFEKYVGAVAGLTDETAVSVTLNGILLPDGVEVSGQGSIEYGIRDGNFFWALVDIPQEEGSHSFTAVVSNTEGGQTDATVYFIVDMVPPKLTITSPSDGLVTSSRVITITGTVDDPEATVRFGWYGSWIPVEDGMFIGQYTLVREGLNYVDVTAMDPAENYSFVTLRITFDTKPPEINVTSPSEGEAVNTPTLTITGSIVEQNIDEVTVSVNGGQPQTLSLTGTNFSGVGNLNPGQNTLTFHAVDKAGNTASLIRSVLLDVEGPAVTITTPLSGAVISGIVDVMVEASDTASGITSVTLYIDGQAHTTLNQSPFNFTLDTSMLVPGFRTITVRAIDRAGNEAEASVSVIIDNSAPVVSIMVPLSGAVVSGLITISVQASDAISGIASVSLYIDGVLLATRNETPFNFPLNTLFFSSGQHTITATGIDNCGNQAEVNITIFFDHEAPTVSITGPASGAVISGIITVSVEASDSISAVAGVTLYVDNQPHSTLNTPPFDFTVDTSRLAPGVHTLTASALDKAGNQGEATITVTVTELIRIEITSPTNGATINKLSLMVQGKIYNQAGEVGVNVNGYLAQVQGGSFAVIVPLQIGQNIITATATRPDGVQGQASITINTETQQEFVRLTAIPTSGVLNQAGILNVTYQAEAYLVNPVSSYSWDFNGDGTIEIAGTEATIIAQYQYPGIYFPRVTVTDNQGTSYTETTIVHLLSREEMDNLLRWKWEGMKNALYNKHILGGLNFFLEFSKEIYQQAFTIILDELPQIVSEMQDIEMIFLIDHVAKYRINRVHNIDGVLQTITYYIYFAKDANGIWKIERF